MFFKNWTFLVCLICILCCLFGLYCLQAQTAAPTQATKRFSEPHSTKAPGPLKTRVFVERDAFSESIDSEFYQTIIQNNLFAPLGTVLNPNSVPGDTLVLLGTRVYPSDPVAASAWLKNTMTGEYREVFLGDSMAGLMLTEVQPRQVTLEGADETVILKLKTDIFLNAKRR
ncbi:MAG: hypothetical protein OXN25_03815 [Candidatus Poribacteria bacterium]|nr:hypothetical protein [Candidatus Poribacteria bacterium]